MRPTREPARHNQQTYMVTSETWGRRDLFAKERWAKLLMDTLFHYRGSAYRLHAFVAMPDHFHVLITPATSLERAVQFIKGGFSHGARVELQSNMEVWQKGFSDHRIRDLRDYAEHVEYIHFNPVRKHLCERAVEYVYSSAHPGYELDPAPQRLKPLALGAVVGAAEAAPLQSFRPDEPASIQGPPQGAEPNYSQPPQHKSGRISDQPGGNEPGAGGPSASSNNRRLIIRPATIADVPALHSMLRAAAEEQGGLEHFCVDEAALREDGFGPVPRFEVIFAELDDEPVGVALYFFNYSTWTGRNGLYLEDLYVKPQCRSRGVARQLMQHLARIALARACERFDWAVLRDNSRAIRFYEAIGAEALPVTLMRLAGGALRQIAAGDQLNEREP